MFITDIFSFLLCIMYIFYLKTFKIFSLAFMEDIYSHVHLNYYLSFPTMIFPSHVQWRYIHCAHVFNENICSLLPCSMKIYSLFSRVQWRYYLSFLSLNEDIISLLSCSMKILSLFSLVKWRYHFSSFVFNEDIFYRMIVFSEDIILYPELSFLLRYTTSLSTLILQDFCKI